jgi:hypothetical protein
VTDRKIPAEQWNNFCDEFSHEHHGWLVSVKTKATRPPQGSGSAKGKPQTLAANLPLQEIREADSSDGVDVMVTVGEGAAETSFLIEDVIDLYSQEIDDKHKGLRIDSRNDTTTFVQFRTTGEPQALNGLAQSEL